MMIDSGSLVLEGNEVSKRKGGDVNLAENNGGKIRVVENTLTNASSPADPQVVSNLRGFLWRMSPEVVFLLETKSRKQEMEVVLS